MEIKTKVGVYITIGYIILGLGLVMLINGVVLFLVAHI